MRTRVFDKTGFRDIANPNWAALLGAANTVVWVDMTGPDADDVRLMRDVFKFHPLAIEDSTDKFQRPKIEAYPDHAFMIMNTVQLDAGNDLVFSELDVFVGGSYIVTVHNHSDPIIEEATRRCTLWTQTGMNVSVGYVVYTLFDALVDGYFPVLDTIGDEIDDLSELVLKKPIPSQLERLFHIKRDLNELWRIAGYQRDMFAILTREEQHFIRDEGLRYFLRDVYDHLLRVSDTVNTLRDTLSGVLDLYLSSTSNRLNIVVQRLTIVTIIIGSLTVIGGFYGMNFEQTFPSFDSPWGVPFAIGLMIVIGALLARVLSRRE
jgi:magnesium transporter